ncbi:MAG TPA: hypothetical protein VGS11_11815 [Candidatus Bathyarchaeia archaeon]|nr:hypothetical protein [Candidatus Bathyarchaeia archaeon]
MDFPRLFDEVVALYRDPDKGISKDGPPLRTEVQNLHDLRNDVQHQGTTPSAEDVSKMTIQAESFVRAVIGDVFAKDLDEILLSDMIPHKEMKAFIREAEQSLASGKYEESCIASAKAFRTLILLEERIEFEKGGGYDKFPSRFNVDELDRLVRRIENLEDQVLVFSIGADYRRYLRFKEKTPTIVITAGGTYNVHGRENWNPSKEDAIEVLDFVFSTAMRWLSTTPKLPEIPEFT